MKRHVRRIGILGGSFNPAHEGHRHISVQALKRLRLDEVWWLVSPGNPLKTRGPAPMEKRLADEKELLGFYISGHPLKPFQSIIDRYCLTNSSTMTKLMMVSSLISQRGGLGPMRPPSGNHRSMNTQRAKTKRWSIRN